MHERAHENPDMWTKNMQLCRRPRSGEVAMATELNSTGSAWQLVCHREKKYRIATLRGNLERAVKYSLLGKLWGWHQWQMESCSGLRGSLLPLFSPFSQSLLRPTCNVLSSSLIFSRSFSWHLDLKRSVIGCHKMWSSSRFFRSNSM